MLAAVVPVKNEQNSICQVIQNLLLVPADIIIPVINGSTDNSAQKICSISSSSVQPLFFSNSLGIDVPRAIGAIQAYKLGAKGVLFVDGDMSGNIIESLIGLKDLVLRGNVDMSLTDCYLSVDPTSLSSLAFVLLHIRFELNKLLGKSSQLGAASPSHGPHVVSRRFLETVPLNEIAIPPVSLALAVKQGLSVKIGAAIPHHVLGSPQREDIHSHMIAETIIGDCIEAMQAYKGEERTRQANGKRYIGYHQARCMDVLKKAVADLSGINKAVKGN